MQFLGQHFLISTSVLAQIIEAAELTPTDTVLEIGPGKGILTRALSERAGKIVAIEKDRELAEELKKEFASMPKVAIITADIREFLLNPTFSATHYSLPSSVVSLPCPPENQNGFPATTHYKVVANIPYYLTSRLIRILLEHDPRPELIVLMIQRAVAERIVAEPPRMNLLGLSVRVYGVPEITAFVPRSAFQPQPKVESAIIRIRPHREPLMSESERDALFQIARMGFGQKRKTLLNTLAGGLLLPKDRILDILTRADIDPLRRAQTLALKEWLSLTKLLDM